MKASTQINNEQKSWNQKWKKFKPFFLVRIQTLFCCCWSPSSSNLLHKRFNQVWFFHFAKLLSSSWEIVTNAASRFPNTTSATTQQQEQLQQAGRETKTSSHKTAIWNTNSHDEWWWQRKRAFKYALSILRVYSLFAIDYRVNTFSFRTTTKQDGFLFLIRQFIICILLSMLKCCEKGRKCRKCIFYMLPCPPVAYIFWKFKLKQHQRVVGLENEIYL